MTSKKLSYSDFCAYMNVPRETFERLKHYSELLIKWQKTINLVADTTINDVWNRHIIDSVQLFKYISANDSLVDLGSGAGFPGLVIAIITDVKMTLVESDRRKIAFLKEAARITETTVEILHKRAEDTDLIDYSVIIARGFAPLATLFDLIEKTLSITHKLLLLKGKNYQSEIDEALKDWSFDYQTYPSITHSDGVILSLTHPRKQRAA